MLDLRPSDRVLEIGCGSGVAAELVCARLRTGSMLAIDRSSSAVARTSRRCRRFLESGRLALAQTELAALSGGRFTRVLAVNVNLFWARDAAAELAVLRRVLTPRGVVVLVFEAPTSSQRARLEGLASTSLGAEGFRVVRRSDGSPGRVALVGTLRSSGAMRRA